MTSTAVSPRAPGVAAHKPAILGRRLALSLAISVAVIICLATLMFWWSTPVTRETGGRGAALVEIGRSTGMLSAILILVEVALMARMPWLEHRVGTDWLAQVHTWLGGYILWLVVTHTVTITIGDAMVVRTSTLHEAKVLELTYPDVLAGTVALGLVALVVTTSLQPIRRHLRYETWHFVHLYVYVAIALAFAHQFATGALFMHNYSARVVWATAHTCVALLVLRYRLLAPVWLYLRHRFRVSEVIQEPDGSTTVYVSGRQLDRLGARPGQYFRWRFLVRGQWWQAHPYSLSHAPNGQWLRMTAKPLGDHSRWLTGMRAGARVVLEGPYGAVTDRLWRRRKILLVGGGSGVAPLIGLAQQAIAAGAQDVTLVYRVSRPDDVIFQQDLHELETTDRFRVNVVTGARGETDADDPLNATLTTELIGDIRDCDVFVCGPPSMAERVIRTLRTAGVPRRRVHTEWFKLG